MSKTSSPLDQPRSISSTSRGWAPPSVTVHSGTVHSGAVLAVAALLATTACGGKTKEPKTLPSQTVTQTTRELEPPPPLPPPIREQAPAPRETVMVIDPGDQSGQPKTLVEASRLAKARKVGTPPSVVEINDENLSEYAEGAQVIQMESGPAAPPPVSAGTETRRGDDTVATSDSLGDPGDERYWRERGLSLRRSWRRALDEIERVELEAAAQRQRFYAEDDPYVRDAQVKPAWDRALDRLTELSDDAERYEVALNEYLDEGRSMDVPPAWLNDGWELEPDEEERRTTTDRPVPTQDSINTPILDTPARDVESGGGPNR